MNNLSLYSGLLNSMNINELTSRVNRPNFQYQIVQDAPLHSRWGCKVVTWQFFRKKSYLNYIKQENLFCFVLFWFGLVWFGLVWFGWLVFCLQCLLASLLACLFACLIACLFACLLVVLAVLACLLACLFFTVHPTLVWKCIINPGA